VADPATGLRADRRRTPPARDRLLHTVGGMQRGQAAIEYSALLMGALLVACALVQFATPVERLALDLAHALVAPHRHPARRPAAARTARRHPRPPVHRCLCPQAAQSRAASDD
jgi:hypothetical protein